MYIVWKYNLYRGNRGTYILRTTIKGKEYRKNCMIEKMHQEKR